MPPTQTLDLREASPFRELRSEWLQLAAGLDDTSYFQSPDWVLSWWETLARRPVTRVGLWRDDSGRLEALVALSHIREHLHRRSPVGFRVLANAGSGVGDGDHGGWPVAPHRLPDVREWLGEVAERATLLLRNLRPACSENLVPLQAQLARADVCPRLILPEAGPIVASGNFRRQLKAYARKLNRGGVSFRWVPPGSLDDAILTSLFELHERGRRHRGLRTVFRADQIEFHRRLMERSDSSRGPAALLGEHDGRVVSMLYGFWWKGTFHAYQSGWDGRWAQFSLGNVSIMKTIEAVRSAGGHTFDFLRGEEPYKYRFGAEDSLNETWILPESPSGRLLSHAYRAANAFRARRGRGTDHKLGVRALEQRPTSFARDDS